MTFELIGEGGQSLKDFWGHSPRAYKSYTVPKMPNYFMMWGPNAIGNRIIIAEYAANYISDAILKLSLSGKSSMTVKKDIFDKFDQDLKAAMDKRTFNNTAGGYMDDGEGYNWQQNPWPMVTLGRSTLNCNESDFQWK